jgi:AcrR family transcriptional regulator
MGRPRGSRSADYEAKRAELAQRLALFMTRDALRRSSLRELAIAAGVTEPTLRHYFGDRDGAVMAAIVHFADGAQTALVAAAFPDGTFQRSIRVYLEVECGRLLAGALAEHGASIAEGLSAPAVGQTYVERLFEPAIAALEARLAAHVKRGEMRKDDLRTAAMTLYGPMFAALLTQKLLAGEGARALDLSAYLDELASTFVRAYALAEARQQSQAG